MKHGLKPPKPTSVARRSEDFAAGYYWSRGYSLLSRNQRGRGWEIDLICQSPCGMLVFVEVKYRKNLDVKLDSLLPFRKRRSLAKGVHMYLDRWDPSGRLKKMERRFDLMVVNKFTFEGYKVFEGLNLTDQPFEV